MTPTIAYARQPHTDNWGYYAWADGRSLCYHATAEQAVSAVLRAILREFSSLDDLAVDGSPCPDVAAHFRAMAASVAT